METLITGRKIFLFVAPIALKATNSLFLINTTNVITQPKTIDKGNVKVKAKKVVYKA